MDATDYASVVVTGSGVPPVTLYHSGVGNRYYFTGSRLVLHEDQAQSGVAPNLQVQYNRARWYDRALGPQAKRPFLPARDCG
ncbi:MAG: hypothetical protein A49_15230 [Methyloceanibacter sp.]|nr:MAG: hypothetical protein A49_15230 [Methyloceanibacter sp.]